MKPDRRDFLALGVGALAVATLPRAFRRKDALIRRQIPVMGTVAEIAVRHPDEAWSQRAVNAAFAELRRVDETMSRFRPASDVGRINAHARGSVVAVGDDTAEVLAAALVWADASDGRFDPCLGRVTELWDVGVRTAPPTGGEKADLAGSGARSVEVRGRSGIVGGGAGRGMARHLELDRAGSVPRVRLYDDKAAVDLGGIAKGYGVDLAARVLRDNGIFNALVNVGGDLVALGVDENEEPWKIGVRSPDQPSQIAHTMRITDQALATSGDYLQYFQYEGRRYHHLLDPLTGEPRRTEMRSLTVAAPTCMAADAGATAAFGADEAWAVRTLGGRATIVHTI